MVGLLEIRQQLKAFFGRYSTYILPLLKFLLMFVTLSTVNSHLGYMSLLDNVMVVLLVSLVCSILPIGASTFFAAVFVLAHLAELSMIAAGLTLILLLAMFCTYYIFQPKDSILLFVVPVLFVFKIPYLAPVMMGLIGSFFSAIPVAFGTLLYYMLRWVSTNTAVLFATTDFTDILQQITQMVNGVFGNGELYVVGVSFTATLFVVYLFRRMSVKYSWEIAIGVGSLVNLVILLVGISSMKMSLGMFPVLLGIVVSALLALVLMFFVFLVDYKRTLETQFEDDEYYYYVKAIPKVSVAPRERQIKRIVSPKAAKAKRAEEEEEMRRAEAVAAVQKATAEERVEETVKGGSFEGFTAEIFIEEPVRKTGKVSATEEILPEEITIEEL